MEYGDRVLIPVAHPWHDSFLEMRLFGNFYQHGYIPAILFRLIELSTHFQPAISEPAVISLNNIIVDPNCRSQVQLTAKMLTASVEMKTNIGKCVLSLAAHVYDRIRTMPQDPEQLLRTLCEIGNFSLRICQGEEFNGGAKPNIDLSWTDQGAVFLLYKSLTVDSFMDFPCGHTGLKYEYFRQLQGLARGQALSLEEMCKLDIRCERCHIPVIETVVRECFRTERNTPKHISGHAATERSHLVSSNLEHSLCMYHESCRNIAVKSYFSDTFETNLCCLCSFSELETVKIHRYMKNYASLRAVAERLPHYQQCETLSLAVSKKPIRTIGGTHQQVVDVEEEKQPNVEKNRAELELAQRKFDEKWLGLSASTSTMKTRNLVGDDAKGNHSIPHRTDPLTIPQELGCLANSSSVSRHNSRKDPLKMPQEVGFLANSFSVPRQNYLNIDLRLCLPLQQDSSTSGSVEVRETVFKSPKQVASGNICANCKSVLVPKDIGFQCPNKCECKLCSIETVIAKGVSQCPHCGAKFGRIMTNQIQHYAKKCHVCEIAFTLSAFASCAPCTVCLRCIKIWGQGKRDGSGKCMRCKSKNFHLTELEVASIRGEKIAHACCNYAETQLRYRNLPCGHPICKIHKSTLRVCRTCRVPVSLE